MAHIWWQDEDPRDTRTATFPEIAIPPDTFADALAGKDAALAYALHASAPPRLEDLIVSRRRSTVTIRPSQPSTPTPPIRSIATTPSVEARLNILGYRLMRTGDAQTAVTVLAGHRRDPPHILERLRQPRRRLRSSARQRSRARRLSPLRRAQSLQHPRSGRDRSASSTPRHHQGDQNNRRLDFKKRSLAQPRPIYRVGQFA